MKFPKLHIVLIAPRFHTNQTGIVRALLDFGCDVEIHVTLIGPTEDHSILTPVKLEESALSRILQNLIGEGGVNKPRSFPSISKYWRRIASRPPDVAIIRGPTRWFSLIAAILYRFNGTQILFYTQTPLHKEYSLSRRICTLVLLTIFKARWFTPVLGSKQHTEKSRSRPPRGMHFLPFCLSDPLATALQPLSSISSELQTDLRILSVGKFEKRKRHDMVLLALARLRNDGRSVRCTIIGEAATEAQASYLLSMMALSEELGVVEYVNFVTNVPHPAMTHHYCNADLFVLAAESEPASISVLEAIASGTPAICSDTCGTACYVEENVNGNLFRCGNEESLYEAISRTLNAIAIGSITFDSCRASYARGFSPAAAVPGLLRLIRELR